MELKPGDKLGPYEIVTAIGKGGMGEVWPLCGPRLIETSLSLVPTPGSISQ